MAIALQIPPIDPRKLLIRILVVLLFVVCFVAGRNSKPSQPTIIQSDDSRLIRKNDSLSAENKSLKIKEIKLLTRIDSLRSVKVINSNKTKRDVAKIKVFTYTSRHRWNDSTLRANGLK